MKLAILSTYPPRKCGIGLYTRNLVDSLRRKNHDVRVLSFKGYDYEDKGVVPILRNRSLFSYIRAANYLRDNGFRRLLVEYEDVFYNPILFPLLLFILRIYGISVTLEFHTIVPYEDQLKKTIFTLYHSIILLFTDNVIVHTKNAELKLISKTLVRRPVRIIPIPIPRRKFVPRIVKSGKPLLLSFGFISYDKGIDILIKALGGIKGVNILIHGSVSPAAMGKQHDYYRKIKKMAAAFSNIRVIDKFISEEEKEKLLSRADLIVLPYRFIEQSAILTEVWAHGKIPVCSDVKAFREELEGNKYGILFRANEPEDLREKVLELIKNKPKQAAILKNIKSLVRKRGFEALAEKYLIGI